MRVSGARRKALPFSVRPSQSKMLRLCCYRAHRTVIDLPVHKSSPRTNQYAYPGTPLHPARENNYHASRRTNLTCVLASGRAGTGLGTVLWARWRSVPTDNSTIGPSALACEPVVQ
eukprot:1341798-Rhodomonas_salina.1